VAALLVSAEGRVLGAGLKSRGPNRTLHAESALVLEHLARRRAPIPRGARLYTTLKCCRMCAAMLAAAAEDGPAIAVFYGENDPGRLATGTGLTAENPLLP
jgi:tRNA(Arg) A34 adenosine deaminase TadA